MVENLFARISPKRGSGLQKPPSTMWVYSKGWIQTLFPAIRTRSVSSAKISPFPRRGKASNFILIVSAGTDPGLSSRREEPKPANRVITSAQEKRVRRAGDEKKRVPGEW